MNEKLVDEIKKCIDNLDQIQLIGYNSGDLVQACKNFLADLGYRIIDPHLYRFKANKIDDLFNLFYELLKRNHPEQSVYMNLNKDRAIAKRFLNARVKASGLDKKQALAECAEIILTVFEYEPDFKFNLPMNFEMFGQENCGWITSKAITIINKKRKKLKETEDEKAQEKCAEMYIKKYGKDSLGYNLDDIIENLEKEK